jgi:hypothetical protein
MLSSGVTRNERARDKNCVMNTLPPHIFLFEGVIYGSFHELATISIFFSFLTLIYISQGTLDISLITADILK